MGFNPFASNASVNTHRDSARSTPPPTYSSHFTTAPTRIPNERTTSVFDRSERVRAWSASLPSASSVASPADTLVEEVDSLPMDTVGIGGTPLEVTRHAGPRYIYYRVYAEDGVIPSVNPVYSDDPYLGRLPAKFVTPPHTVINIKRCLSGFEKIDDNIPTNLFVSASSQAPMKSAGPVAILAYPGPGCTPNDPMALVAMFSSVDRDRLGVIQQETPPEGSVPFETRYLYYRVYQQYGAVPSRQPADSSDPYVGRISVDSVPPPHTAVSIMRCISKTEELANSKKLQLFINISSDSPIGDGHVSILASDCPGCTPEDPMVFVELPSPAVAQPAAAEPSPAPVVVPTLIQPPTFNKRMRVITAFYPGSQNPDWLTIRKRDILRTTHDPPQLQQWIYPDRGTCRRFAHEAVNAKGKVGFVEATKVKPC